MKTIDDLVFYNEIAWCEFEDERNNEHVSPRAVIDAVINEPHIIVLEKYKQDYTVTIKIEYNQFDKSVDIYYGVVNEHDIMYYKTKKFNPTCIGYEQLK